jgi:hypothetical protein
LAAAVSPILSLSHSATADAPSAAARFAYSNPMPDAAPEISTLALFTDLDTVSPHRFFYRFLKPIDIAFSESPVKYF